MYSPRISEDLIPLIYQVARAKKMPMTQVVDEILRLMLKKETEKINQMPNDGSTQKEG